MKDLFYGKNKYLDKVISDNDFRLYTFYCVVLAILNLVRLKKDRTVQKIMLRNCSMVYAIGSLFGLERMMLGTFGNAEEHFTLIMEALSGAGFFIIIVLFGINLLMLSSKMANSPHI